MRFSANLGFLWTGLSLPDAIRAAKANGFDADECHWPYETAPQDVKTALDETGLEMLGLNTLRGDLNGLSAVPGRAEEARMRIDEAIAYARTIGCGAVHVMAGFTDQSVLSETTFQSNLTYACEQATELTFLIEPLNTYDAPDYHLSTIDAARDTIDGVALPNLKIMFDLYHIGIMQGDLTRRVKETLPDIGHIQFAAVPDRAEPDHGEINYPWLLREISDMGWDRPFGAEYKPRAATEEGLGWMSDYRS